MTADQMDQISRLYQPSIESQASHLHDLGEALHTAAIDLSRDCSLDRLDRFSAQLNAAQTSLQHLRKALAAKETTGWGTG